MTAIAPANDQDQLERVRELAATRDRLEANLATIRSQLAARLASMSGRVPADMLEQAAGLSSEELVRELARFRRGR